MGVSIEVFRCRIGLFNFCSCSSKLSTLRPSGKSILLKHVPVAVLCILLLIAGIEPNPGPELRCKFCNSMFPDVGTFIDHSKIHTSTKNFSILCGMPNCLVRLTSPNSFRVHVSRIHTTKVTRKIENDTVCSPSHVSCPVSTCASKITSREFYNKHMVEHLKKGDSFQCILGGCSSQLSYIAQFRTHNSRKHRVCREVDAVNVEDEAEGSCDGNVPESCEDSDDNSSNFILEGLDSEPSTNETDLFPDFLVKQELARFYLKLEAVFLLPSSTVQAIAEEIKVMTELIHYRLRRGLEKELEPLNLETDVLKSIVMKTFKHDTVFNVHHKHEDAEQLGTMHMRSKFWSKNYPFIEPQEISLGVDEKGKARKAHFVSIRESLNVLLKDEKIKQLVLESFKQKSGDSEVLRDYTDGTAYREHCKTHEGPCLQILKFQDAFDFNPLGASSGLYKPLGFYYTLGNIPPMYRSKLDLIQLVYMILEQDLKPTQEQELQDFDKMKEALKPILDELKDLHENGIEIDGQKIRVCLMFALGDSLGQHVIGGFVKNFSSSEFSCRFCPMSKTEFLLKPYETKPLRTREEYNEYVIIAKRKWNKLRKDGLKARKKAQEQAKKRAEKVSKKCTAPSKKRDLKGRISKSAYQKLCAVNFRGVKYRPSPLNSSSFHVISSQPPCLAHDLFEGLVKTVIAEILKYCIEVKNWFDLQCLNRRIQLFKCKGSDARDAPTPLKSLDKLSGNACENWNMVRLLPFIIGDLIEDPQDPMWQLYLLLKQICEYVCAPSITKRQVLFLQHNIECYLSQVQQLLPSCLTPKSHFLCHYPELIIWFGPLIRLFTLRFESKHSFFKNVVKACKNYINITCTMAKKYMCRFAYDHSTGDILPLDLLYNSNFTFGLNLNSLPEDLRAAFPPNFNASSFIELREVKLNGIEYHKDYCFVLRSADGTGLEVGCIEMILLDVSKNEVFFLLREKIAENTFMGYYIIQKMSKGVKLATLEQLPDYYALPTYSLEGHECLSLKHSVITME